MANTSFRSLSSSSCLANLSCDRERFLLCVARLVRGEWVLKTLEGRPFKAELDKRVVLHTTPNKINGSVILLKSIPSWKAYKNLRSTFNDPLPGSKRVVALERVCLSLKALSCKHPTFSVGCRKFLRPVATPFKERLNERVGCKSEINRLESTNTRPKKRFRLYLTPITVL